MSEKPILFSGPMVQAILAGTKTMTRRVVKPQPQSVGDVYDGPADAQSSLEYYQSAKLKAPYAVGDILWVRETWWCDAAEPVPNDHPLMFYKANQSAETKGMRWRPSRFMPKWACRIRLEVTAVRVERLHGITDGDIYAEGCLWHEPLMACKDVPGASSPAQRAFARLWDSLNSKRGYSWESNPWVFVYTFKVVKP